MSFSLLLITVDQNFPTETVKTSYEHTWNDVGNDTSEM